MTRNSRKRGFIALISAVVIGAVLIAMMTSVGLASFYARFDALGIENKQQATALAESCINSALLALATSSDPTHYVVSNQSILVGVDSQGSAMTCVIKDLLQSGSNVTIDTYASSDDSFGAISITASLSPKINITSWNQY
jgi:hypothetical protein